MNKVGDLGDLSGQLISVPKKIVDEAVKEPAEVFEKVEEQTGAKPTASQNPPNDDKSTDSLDKKASPSQKDTLEIIKKMYEASDTKGSVPSDKIIAKVIQENPKKTPEEIQKLAATRQQLLQQQHMATYFEPTFNRPSRPEERPAEQIEKEKKEEKQMEELKLQKEEKKKEELLSVTKGQGTHEKIPGVSG